MTTWMHASCECCVKLFRYARDFLGGTGNVEARDSTGAIVSELTIAPSVSSNCHDISLGFSNVHFGVAGARAGRTKSDGTSVWDVSLPNVFDLFGVALNRDASIVYVCGQGKQVPSLGDDLYSLNPATGAVIASTRAVSGATGFSTVGDVAVDDAGLVYVVTGEGDLIRYPADLSGSGTTLFSTVDSSPGVGAFSSLDVDSGSSPDILLVGQDDENADLAIDRTIWLVDSTGSVVWKHLRGFGNYPAGLSPFGGAALDGVGGAYILASTFSSKTLWKFRQSDGLELWSQFTSSTSVNASKIDVDGVHVTGGGGRAFAVLSATGAFLFETGVLSYVVHAGRLRKLR